MLAQLTDSKARDFSDQIGSIFKGVPHIPKSWVKFLVKIAPRLAGLGGLTNVLSGFSSVMGGGAFNSMMYHYAGVGRNYFLINGIFSLLLGVLLLMAFSPLKAKKMDGWMYLFWTQILGVVQTVVLLAYFGGGWLASVIGIVLGLYILFEIKPAYK